MRKLHQATFGVALAAVTAFALTPTAVRAQDTDTQEQSPACTAQIEPSALHAGEKAVKVHVTLSQSVGEISSIEGAGVALADPADLPKSTMAQSGEENEDSEAAKPVDMASDGASATLWLNTVKATAGDQDLTLTGEDGTCTAKVKVQADDSSESGQG